MNTINLPWKQSIAFIIAFLIFFSVPYQGLSQVTPGQEEEELRCQPNNPKCEYTVYYVIPKMNFLNTPESPVLATTRFNEMKNKVQNHVMTMNAFFKSKGVCIRIKTEFITFEISDPTVLTENGFAIDNDGKLIVERVSSLFHEPSPNEPPNDFRIGLFNVALTPLITPNVLVSFIVDEFDRFSGAAGITHSFEYTDVAPFAVSEEGTKTAVSVLQLTYYRDTSEGEDKKAEITHAHELIHNIYRRSGHQSVYNINPDLHFDPHLHDPPTPHNVRQDKKNGGEIDPLASNIMRAESHRVGKLNEKTFTEKQRQFLEKCSAGKSGKIRGNRTEPQRSIITGDTTGGPNGPGGNEGNECTDAMTGACTNYQCPDTEEGQPQDCGGGSAPGCTCTPTVQPCECITASDCEIKYGSSPTGYLCYEGCYCQSLPPERTRKK